MPVSSLFSRSSSPAEAGPREAPHRDAPDRASGGASRPAPASRFSRASRFVRRHRVGVAAALLVAALAVAAVAATGVGDRRADEERQRAEEAAAFLTAVLERIGPEQVRRTGLEPRSVLDAGVARIRTELAGRPLLQARLFDGMGRIYQSWGLHPDARGLLEAGLRLRLGELGEDHPAVAESRLHLGLLGHELGAPGADTLFTSALAVYRRHLEPGDPALRRALVGYGLALRDRGDLAGAAGLLREALGPERVPPADADGTVATALTELGRMLTVRGSHAAADSLLGEALAARRAIHGESSPRVADALDALGELDLARGAPEAALGRFVEALRMRYEFFDGGHPEVGASLHNIALAERARGNLRRSEAVLRRSLGIARRAFGAESVEVARRLESMAGLRRELGDSAEAEALYAEALAIWSRRGARFTDPSEGRALLGLGELRLARGDAEGAEPLLREAVRIRELTLPHGHWRTATARGTLGAGLTALERHQEAEVHLTDAYETLSRRQGPEDPRTREVLAHLVSLYDGWQGPGGLGRYDRLATTLRVRESLAERP